MVVGLEVYFDLVQNSTIPIFNRSPSAFQTAFGWIISGPLVNEFEDATLVSANVTIGTSLESILLKFWEVEEADSLPAPTCSTADQHVEDFFLRTTRRDASGRFSVSIPFKENAPPLSPNSEIALRNYERFHRRLCLSPERKKEYDKFMQEYLDLGHMSPAPRSASYILPHHCVVREDSSTTKLRVVFNASAPDSAKISLNERMYTGPKLQADLPFILAAFLFQRVALTCDVKKMYRQILISDEDRIFQHVYWTPPEASAPKEFELNTVTYGMAVSPYLAQRVLRQLVHEDGASYPMASTAISSFCYMDNVITGADSVASALQLRQELTHLFRLGGFELHKWASNCPQLLSDLEANIRDQPLQFGSLSEPTLRVLGVLWDPDRDIFRYAIAPFTGEFTKLSLLSYVAKAFDPMGWIAPVIFWIKHFIQRLWLNKLGWHDLMPPPLVQDWNAFASSLPLLNDLILPRFIPRGEGYTLHLSGFADASKKGYAAVVYAVSIDKTTGKVHSRILRAKTKLVPAKTAENLMARCSQDRQDTPPRLELCGALMLAKLLKELRELPDTRFESVTAYSDSAVVLAWIANDPKIFSPFVESRVRKIRDLTKEVTWKYVPSKENPADIASRGASAASLIDADIWWNGPSEWQEAQAPELEELPEIRKQVKVCATAAITAKPRLRRYAFTLIFVWRLKRRLGAVTTQEIGRTFSAAIRDSQHRHFGDALMALRAKKLAPKNLRTLSPFLDEDGFLRVGGRLKNSDLPFETKHPLLLSGRSVAAKFICDDLHVRHCHAGPTALTPLVQSKYWILGLRNLLRERFRTCWSCRSAQGATSQPPMADLPAVRVRPAAPFSNVGVDFAGPFTLKETLLRRTRNYKAYLAVFVCMVTKAVHLEIVTALSTAAFLASLDRMTSRRGLPSDIYSDCGTNFVGASRSLQEWTELLEREKDRLISSLASRQIKWHFNPPHAPNFGGLWEAAVKSAKQLFHRTIRDRVLTYEELSTFFCRCEAVLNSRPLVAQSDTPDENVGYLSPAHLVILRPLLSPAEPVMDDTSSYRCRWDMLKQLSQKFWREWSSCYLNTLVQRFKWHRAGPQVSIGQNVIITDEQTAPLSWPIGVIEKVSPGSDGVVRVVTIRTDSGTLIRPVNKLIILPPRSLTKDGTAPQ